MINNPGGPFYRVSQFRFHKHLPPFPPHLLLLIFLRYLSLNSFDSESSSSKARHCLPGCLLFPHSHEDRPPHPHSCLLLPILHQADAASLFHASVRWSLRAPSGVIGCFVMSQRPEDCGNYCSYYEQIEMITFDSQPHVMGWGVPPATPLTQMWQNLSELQRAGDGRTAKCLTGNDEVESRSKSQPFTGSQYTEALFTRTGFWSGKN